MTAFNISLKQLNYNFLLCSLDKFDRLFLFLNDLREGVKLFCWYAITLPRDATNK